MRQPSERNAGLATRGAARSCRQGMARVCRAAGRLEEHGDLPSSLLCLRAPLQITTRLPMTCKRQHLMFVFATLPFTTTYLATTTTACGALWRCSLRWMALPHRRHRPTSGGLGQRSRPAHANLPHWTNRVVLLHLASVPGLPGWRTQARRPAFVQVQF